MRPEDQTDRTGATFKRRVETMFDRARLMRLADGLAIALAASLPWSTTATSILVGLWLLALLPTLEPSDVRREVMTPAGGLPVVLWALAVVGMFWADVSWSERFHGLSQYHKLLVVPLLLAQFRRSDNGMRVLWGFFAASVALLLVSWVLALLPELPWRGRGGQVGVPVNDYVVQSGIFAICIFALMGKAIEIVRVRRWQFAAALVVVAALFAANIFFVATGRTNLVTLVVLLVLFGVWHFSWKGILTTTTAGIVLASAVWASSSYIQDRVTNVVVEIERHHAGDDWTSSGHRLHFWSKSAEFIADAPVIGHGTGTIREMFSRSAVGQTGTASLVTPNPHNQTLAVAIQLGGVGAAVLIAMWMAHLLLFHGGGLIAWTGLVVVTQNVIGSLFNTHIFDFSQGWLYVIGVGVLGGMMLRRTPTRGQEQKRPAGAVGSPS